MQSSGSQVPPTNSITNGANSSTPLILDTPETWSFDSRSESDMEGDKAPSHPKRPKRSTYESVEGILNLEDDRNGGSVRPRTIVEDTAA